MRVFLKLIVFALLPAVFAFAGELQTTIMDLKNIQCYACLNTVKRALQNAPGVDDAHLDFKKKIAIVEFDPTKTNTKMLLETTAKAGFPASIRN